MPKLPTRDSLGALPDARSGRPIARVDTSAVGEGMQEAGRAAVRFGATLAQKSKEEEDQREALEIEKRVLLYGREQERLLEEQRREMAEGGRGFAENWRRSYDQGADGVVDQARRDGLSERAVTRLSIGLQRAGETYHSRANRFQQDEERRFNHDSVLTSLQERLAEVRADPGRLADARRLGEIQIATSALDRADRPAMRRQFLRQLEEEARTALLQGIQTSQDADRAAEAVIGHVVPDRRPLRDRGGRILDGSEGGVPASQGRMAIGRQVYDYFVGRGLQPHQAAAVAGNMAWEGGGRADLVNPNDNRRNSPNSPHSFGIGQWNDRLPALIAFARGQGIEIPEGDLRDVGYVRSLGRLIPLQTQLAFAWDEMQGPEARAGTGVRSAEDIRGATAAAIGYHRPAGWTRGNPESGHGFADRLALAERVLADAGARPASAANAPAAAGRRAALGGPQGPSGPIEDRSADAGYAADPAAAGALPGPPMRVGGPEWVQAQLDAEERGEGVRDSAFTATTGPQARAFANAVQARRAQIRTSIQQQFQTWEANARDGVPPPAPLVAQVREQVESFNDPQLTENFEFLVGSPPSERFPQGRPGLAATVQAMRRLRPDEMDAIVQAEERNQQTRGATDLDKKRLDHLRSLVNTARAEVERDQNGWAQRVGAAEQMGVDFSRGFSFQDDASMRAHAEAARTVGRYLGRLPRFFSPEQVQAAQGILRQGGEPMLQVLGSIVRNWGADARTALAEIAPNDPELAAIGSMFANAQRNNGAGMEAVERAAREIEARRDPNYRKLADQYKPTEVELRDASSVLGSAFQELAQTQAAAVAAANLIYQSRAVERGLAQFDPVIWRQGLMEVLGQSTERNVTYGGLYHQRRGWFGGDAGLPVPVPSNMRQDAIPRILDVLRPEDLIDDVGFGPVTGDGRYISDRDLRQATLVYVGSGRYALAQGDPTLGGQARWVMDSRGGRYMLDLNQLEPTLRQRIPEIYRGYVEPVPVVRSPESVLGRRVDRQAVTGPQGTAADTRRLRPTRRIGAVASGRATPEWVYEQPPTGGAGGAAPAGGEAAQASRAEGPGVVDRVREAASSIYERVFGRPEPTTAGSEGNAESNGGTAARPAPVVPPDRIWEADGDTTGNERAIRRAANAVASAASLEEARRALSGMVQRQSEASDPEEAEALARENRGEFFNMYSWRARIILQAAMTQYVNSRGAFRSGLTDKQRREGEIIVALYNELTVRNNADTQTFNAYRTPGSPQNDYYAIDPTSPASRIKAAAPRRRNANVVTVPIDLAAQARFPFEDD